MFNFKLYSKPTIPAFPALAAYEHKNFYFCRVALWNWLDNNRIVVSDPHAPRMITMDPWPQLLFLDATGERTVAEYVDYMAHRYKRDTPEKLDATIIAELEKLVQSRLLILADSPITIHPTHDQPYSPKE